ncbi:unnamed protein product [Vitrella brassicaformis CCMP3155]|uniref:Ion transport domain-containing protein n=1 Tax=Vitrella brassicaformis (strain CCMP3155) TaxID=1169540 RepID=A0A0G4FQ69_VITBC|nr:unnamed protein product [Vitrella brassicaformis CCMP3155]|eukprot:CEM16582.1 unnamed protein product [Vitrella brassicaformis CCMP3155]
MSTILGAGQRYMRKAARRPLVKRSTTVGRLLKRQTDVHIAPRQPSMGSTIAAVLCDPDVCRKSVHLLLEYPDSSQTAQIVAVAILTLIIISISSFIIKTLPALKDREDLSALWFSLEAGTTVIFTLEFVLRIWAWTSHGNSHWEFVASYLNWFDLISILPFYLEVILGSLSDSLKGLRVLRAVRLTRIFRVLKLSRYSSGLQLMLVSIQASLGPLNLMVFSLALCVIVFSSLLYTAEFGHNTEGFESIPSAMFFSLLTLTTVGYGSRLQTDVGRCIAGVASVFGIMVISMPVGLVGFKFQIAYWEMEQQVKAMQEEADSHSPSRRFRMPIPKPSVGPSMLGFSARSFAGPTPQRKPPHQQLGVPSHPPPHRKRPSDGSSDADDDDVVWAEGADSPVVSLIAGAPLLPQHATRLPVAPDVGVVAVADPEIADGHLPHTSEPKPPPQEATSPAPMTPDLAHEICVRVRRHREALHEGEKRTAALIAKQQLLASKAGCGSLTKPPTHALHD